MQPGCIYRMFDEAGRLLYVGSTTRLPDRLAMHSKETPWWRTVVSITVEHCASRDLARAAEAQAIAAEHPLHNVQRPWQKMTPEQTATAQRVRHEKRAQQALKAAQKWSTSLKVECSNCGSRPPQLTRGIPVAEQECPQCGCVALRMRDEVTA